eukprot:11164033-Lingulodinium_polyedra.AAC.1
MGKWACVATIRATLSMFWLKRVKTQEKQRHQVWMRATVITLCIPHVKDAGKSRLPERKV